MSAFVEEVFEEVKKIADGYDVRLDSVDKGNGVIRKAITFRAEGSNIAPSVYIDENGDDAEAVAKKLVEAAKGHVVSSMDFDWFADYDKVKDKLYICLTSHPAEGLVTKEAFCDILMTAAVDVGNFAGVGGSIQVRENHLVIWGIDKETLFRDALESAKTVRPVLKETLFSVVPMPVVYMPGIPDTPDFMILSNTTKTNGASAVLYADLPEEFVMIPSSRHEVIILSGMALTGDYRGLTEMVKIVNATSLQPVDILSYNAYHYVNGEWSIIE